MKISSDVLQDVAIFLRSIKGMFWKIRNKSFYDLSKFYTLLFSIDCYLEIK
jgi:hypothetical protein